MSERGLVVCDLDGVVWLSEEVLPGVSSAVGALRGAGLEVLFLTNNSSIRVAEVVQRLAGADVEVPEDDVLTSAGAAATLLARELPAGSPVLACAGPAVVEALEREGFRVVDSGPCEAVVVGWHTSFDYDALHRASAAVREGGRFVATNLDATYPTPDGLLPGNGALVAAVATAAGVDPEVAGKPELPTADAVRRRAGERPGVVVGDRPSSDGVLAGELGWPFALVESRVAATEEGVGPEPDARAPDLVSIVDDVVRLVLGSGPGAGDTWEQR